MIELYKKDLQRLKDSPVEEQAAWVNEHITVKATVITPEIAKSILDTTHKAGFKNRNLTKSTLLRYTAIMANGEWNPATGETIQLGFYTETGKNPKRVLLNGHHRFNAVVAAKTPVVMLVAQGVPLASFFEMDQGNSRTLANMGQIDGWQAPEKTTAAGVILRNFDIQHLPEPMVSCGDSKSKVFEELIEMGIKEEVERTYSMYSHIINKTKKTWQLAPKVPLALFCRWDLQNHELVDGIQSYLTDPVRFNDIPYIFKYVLDTIKTLPSNEWGEKHGGGAQREFFAIRLLCLAWAIANNYVPHTVNSLSGYNRLISAYMKPKEEVQKYHIVPWRDLYTYSFRK